MRTIYSALIIDSKSQSASFVLIVAPSFHFHRRTEGCATHPRQHTRLSHLRNCQFHTIQLHSCNMSEQPQLEQLGVIGEWVWGDDDETVVFAQAFSADRTLLFQFTLDDTRTNTYSQASRIVHCFHDVDVSDPKATFPDRSFMRVATWSAVASIWNECIQDEGAAAPDSIIDIVIDDKENREPMITWTVIHDSRFLDYLGLLSPLDQFKSLQHPFDTVNFDTLVRYEQLGGRGCTTRVTKQGDTQHNFVFKVLIFDNSCEPMKTDMPEKKPKTSITLLGSSTAFLATQTSSSQRRHWLRGANPEATRTWYAAPWSNFYPMVVSGTGLRPVTTAERESPGNRSVAGARK